MSKLCQDWILRCAGGNAKMAREKKLCCFGKLDGFPHFLLSSHSKSPSCTKNGKSCGFTSYYTWHISSKNGISREVSVASVSSGANRTGFSCSSVVHPIY